MKRRYSLLFPAIALVACSKVTLDPKEPVETLAAPSINWFTSEADTVGAVVRVVGKNISQRIQNNVVSFNGVEATSFYTSKDTLKVRVPLGAMTGPLHLRVYKQTVIASAPFTVVTGRWKKKADCPCAGRFDGVGFAIGTKCYIGTGTGTGYYQDFWEYDTHTNTWSQKAEFAGGPRREAVSFVINGKGYVGFGTNTSSFSLAQDFFEYDPASNRWTRKANVPSFYTRNAVGLSVNGKGYIITGDFSTQVFEYTPQTDTWAAKSNFPGQQRAQAAGFVIGTKAYVGGGNSGGTPYLRDFWQYDPAIDQWTRKANLPTDCVEGVGFEFKGKGYLGVGYSIEKQVDEYDPVRDVWNRKTNYPGLGWFGAVAFSTASHAYVANGLGQSSRGESTQIWELIP